MSTIVRLTCEGTKPLLMERMTEETLEHLLRGTRPSIDKKRKLNDIAEEKLYVIDGKLCIPADNFWACLVEGGPMVDYKGKKKISNSEESLLPAFLDIKEELLPFTNGDVWVVDKRRGRLDNGTAVCIVRPRFNRWGFTATLVIDETMISPDKIKELVEAAGKFKGLGGHRKKGRFGRFQIVSWEVVSSDSKSRKRKSETDEKPQS